MWFVEGQGEKKFVSVQSDEELIYKDQFPEEIENWQGDTSDPTFKRDDFELYGGPYSPRPISKIKHKIHKNQYFAAISNEGGSYVWNKSCTSWKETFKT